MNSATQTPSLAHRFLRIVLRSAQFSMLVGFTAIMVGCTAINEEVDLESHTVITFAEAPSVFVDDAIELIWHWRELNESERYVIRISHNDQTFDIWSATSAANIQPAIASFETDMGLFGASVAAVRVDENGNFVETITEWSEPTILQRVRRLALVARPLEEQSPLSQWAHTQEWDSFSHMMQGISHFVYTHSDVTDEIIHYEPDHRDAIELMMAFSRGEHTQRPGMFCTNMATAMLTALRDMGIESRLVFLMGDFDSSGYITQHTMLEVFNPDSQYWELYDPTFDTYYRDIATRANVDVGSLVFGDLSRYEQCINQTSECQPIAEDFSTYFEVVQYGYSNERYVNPSRFRMNNLFSHWDQFPDTLGTDPRAYTYYFDREVLSDR